MLRGNFDDSIDPNSRLREYPGPMFPGYLNRNASRDSKGCVMVFISSYPDQIICIAPRIIAYSATIRQKAACFAKVERGETEATNPKPISVKNKETVEYLNCRADARAVMD